MNNTDKLTLLALQMTNRDVAAAARLLAEWCGTSVEYAITAVDELIVFDDAPPSDPVQDYSAQSEFSEDPEFSDDPEFSEDPEFAVDPQFGPDKDFEQ